jgi:hypothetical protein
VGFLAYGFEAAHGRTIAGQLCLLGAFVPTALAEPELHQAGIESALATARLLAECGAPVVVLAVAM